MKMIFSILLSLLFCVKSASAQDSPVTYWETFLIEDFEENLIGWPVGSAQEGNLRSERQIADGDYIWKLTSPQPNYSLIGFYPEYPSEPQRFRFQANLLLPDFEPYACGGILFEGKNEGGIDSFYAYLVCNNKSYSLVRNENGVLTEAIPPSPIPEYDSFSDFNMAVEINDGWADLLFNDESIDTFQTGFERGNVGLIAMPQSVQETEIRFGSFDLYYTNDSLPDSLNAGYVDPNAGDKMTRTLKMLGMKQRISTSGGIWAPLSGDTMELAAMGLFGKSSGLLFGNALYVESDMSWDSAYEHPDYANAGCGFYLRDDGNGNFIEVYAGMDGILYVNSVRAGKKTTLLKETYDAWSIQGAGKLGVAVDGTRLTVLWNGKILAESDTVPSWEGGSTGYLIHSGTNADFGTRCVFSGGESYTFAQ